MRITKHFLKTRNHFSKLLEENKEVIDKFESSPNLTAEEMTEIINKEGAVLLRGEKGETARVMIVNNNHIVRVDMPLSFTVREARKWFSDAFNGFKYLVSKKEVVAINEDFIEIIKKPYTESNIEYKQDQEPSIVHKVRNRFYTGEEVGTSPNPIALRKRNSWIKKRYKELRQKTISYNDRTGKLRQGKTPEQLCYKEIAEELKQKKMKDEFGFGIRNLTSKRDPYNLDDDTIKAIVHHKS
jgi:glycogen debranching enzyme